jgi:hypothetical protein
VEVEMAEEAAAGEEESTLKNILRKFSIKMWLLSIVQWTFWDQIKR